ncbi:MAG: hypothetical protein EHM24_00420 [Acidobacteria bacterium]|nr:MAG: hypothetical protein EHM24_00420 [Acidobacteriota bacterium]
MNDRPGMGYGSALGAAALAALAAAASLVFVYATNPTFWPPLQLIPSLGSGFYPVEQNEGGAFCWMGAMAELRLEGLDRRVAWACDIRVRGGRPPSASQPMFTVAADGRVLASAGVTNVPAHVTFTVPVQQERRGVTLTFTTSSTFTPGTGDTRNLGVVVEDLACRPAAGIPLPPRGALGRASLAGAVMGAGFGLLQITPGTAVGASVAVAALQAIPLALGAAPYAVLGTAAVWMAVVLATLLVAGVRLAGRLRGVPLRNTGRFVAAFTAAVLYLKVLVLLHPETAAATPAAATLRVFLDDRALEVTRAALNAAIGLLLYRLGCGLLGDRLAAAGGAVIYQLAPGSFGGGLAGQSTALVAPLIVLAAAGTIRLAARKETRRLSLVLAAWGFAALVGGAWLSRPEMAYPVTVYPPLALAAAAGAAWGWSIGRLGARVTTSIVLSGVLWAAAVAWLSEV